LDTGTELCLYVVSEASGTAILLSYKLQEVNLYGSLCTHLRAMESLIVLPATRHRWMRRS